MDRLSVEEFREAEKLPLIVVLDDVRSLYNVGSVFRSADAFRVEAIYLCGITATPPNAEIHKTALGGEDSVAWRYFERTEEAVEELHRKGVFVYSVEQAEGSTKLQDLDTRLLTSAPREMEQNCPAADTSHPIPPPAPDTRHPLRPCHGQRGERSEADCRGHERRLSGDTAVRHQAFTQCQRHGRHRNLGVCTPAAAGINPAPDRNKGENQDCLK